MSSSNRGNYSVQSLGHNEIPGIHYVLHPSPIVSDSQYIVQSISHVMLTYQHTLYQPSNLIGMYAAGMRCIHPPFWNLFPVPYQSLISNVTLNHLEAFENSCKVPLFWDTGLCLLAYAKLPRPPVTNPPVSQSRRMIEGTPKQSP